jgi:nucleoside-diphosphate-sugar epimerase
VIGGTGKTGRRVAARLRARGEPVRIAALEAESVPGDYVSLLDYLFVTVLDGRNEHIGDGVQRALGRERRDFRDYAMAAARTGAWAAPASLAV